MNVRNKIIKIFMCDCVTVCHGGWKSIVQPFVRGVCVLFHEHIRHFLNLYVVTLNCLWKYLRVIDRTSFLCVLTCAEAGGRVRPLSPSVTFFNHFSIVVGIPSTFLRFLHDTWNQKRRKRKKP